ncbi:Fic family protein [Planococcus lenghuensis]|uniref:Fic family protein n=1 Tax=Planococcus lenghuensis TaxID=2213202 RepID=UPI001E5D21E1|nr:Fic family protein [Planococcus lenghuensis]
MAWYQAVKAQLHPVELAADFHAKFACTLPFTRGNGHVSRLLMNLSLMESGFPPAIISSDEKNRLQYFTALESAIVWRNSDLLIRLVAGCVEDSLNLQLNMVT